MIDTKKWLPPMGLVVPAEPVEVVPAVLDEVEGDEKLSMYPPIGLVVDG